MKKICIIITIFFAIPGIISCNEGSKKENESENYPAPAQTQGDSDRTSVKMSKEGVSVENKSGNKSTEIGVSSDSINFESEKKK